MFSALHHSGKHSMMLGRGSIVAPASKRAGRSLQHSNVCSSSSSSSRSSILRFATNKRPNLARPQQQQPQPRRSKSTTATPKAEEIVIEPSFQALKMVALTQAIPFVGFGFMDNAILIVAGDAIDTSLGVVFGISTLCAAAIGNIVSDLAGIGMGTVIEDFCANYLKMPVPNLSAAQRRLRRVRFAGQLGMALGMTFGCIVGMFPLLYIDSDKIPRLKQKAKLEALFRDVVTDAKTLVGAESTVLYLRVDREEITEDQSSAVLPYKPNVEGDNLYAMFYDVPATAKKMGYDESSRVVPLGKGIVSRAMLTGLAWTINDVKSEPDFYPLSREHADHMRQMLVVPVLDRQGRAIAVIRAMNKVEGGGETGGGFTDQDVLILKSLASHISVSLQSMYKEEEKDEDARLRDTIRILKEHGIDGLQRARRRESLFPESG
jgi:hypothetical protein